jgi:hypothetical protein
LIRVSAIGETLPMSSGCTAKLTISAGDATRIGQRALSSRRFTTISARPTATASIVSQSSQRRGSMRVVTTPSPATSTWRSSEGSYVIVRGPERPAFGP